MWERVDIRARGEIPVSRLALNFSLGKGRDMTAVQVQRL